MTVHYRGTRSQYRQRGAALVIALTLIGAVSLLAATAIHEATVDAAMTRNFAARVDSRLATRSAIETFLAEGPLPLSGEIRRRMRIDDDAQSQVQLRVVHLGDSVRADRSSDDGTTIRFRHYEITAEAADAHSSRHRRLLYHHVAIGAE